MFFCFNTVRKLILALLISSTGFSVYASQTLSAFIRVQDTLPAQAKAQDTSKPVKKPSGPFVLVLDAGHGGRATGAQGKFSNEKDITLDICMKVGAMIKERNPEIRLIYTRISDEFVGLQDRADIANDSHASLFVAIHCNSIPKHRVSPMGAETYVLGLSDASRNLDAAIRENSDITQEANYQQTYGGFDPNSPESYIIFSMKQSRNLRKSMTLANQIQAEFEKNGRIDRGVKQEPILVLRNTTMPGVLVETGYISSREEEEYLNSDEGQQNIAQSIYDGIIKYKNLLFR